MSAEQAKAFIEKLNSDETFRNQVNDAENNAARLQLAKAAGFEFTAEELTGVINELSSEELSEDELDAVAGGRVAFKVDLVRKLSSSGGIEQDFCSRKSCGSF